MSTRSTLGPAAQRAAQALFADLDGATAVAIATVDGFALGQAGTQRLDADRLAAIVSSLSALGDAASRELDLGRTRCQVVDASLGRLVMRSVEVGDETVVVVVLTEAKALMGLVLNRLAGVERLLIA